MRTIEGATMMARRRNHGGLWLSEGRSDWRAIPGRGLGARLRLDAHGHLLGDDPRAAARLSGVALTHAGCSQIVQQPHAWILGLRRVLFALSILSIASKIGSCHR